MHLYQVPSKLPVEIRPIGIVPSRTFRRQFPSRAEYERPSVNSNRPGSCRGNSVRNLARAAAYRGGIGSEMLHASSEFHRAGKVVHGDGGSPDRGLARGTSCDAGYSVASSKRLFSQAVGIAEGAFIVPFVPRDARLPAL